MSAWRCLPACPDGRIIDMQGGASAWQSAHEARDPAVWILELEARFPFELLHRWCVSCGILCNRRQRDQQAGCSRSQQ